MKEEENKVLGFSEIAEMIECQHNDEIGLLKEGIDDGFEKAVKKCLEYGKSSEMTIKLKFSYEDSRRIKIVSEVKTKLPTPSPTCRSVYHDQRGNLRKEDPSLPKNLPGISPLKKVG